MLDMRNLIFGGTMLWDVTQLRERSERNKQPPAMRVGNKKLYKKASFPLILRLFKPVQEKRKDA